VDHIEKAQEKWNLYEKKEKLYSARTDVASYIQVFLDMEWTDVDNLENLHDMLISDSLKDSQIARFLNLLLEIKNSNSEFKMKTFIANNVKKIFNHVDWDCPPPPKALFSSKSYSTPLKGIQREDTKKAEASITHLNNLIEFLHYSLYFMYLCCFPTFLNSIEVEKLRKELLRPKLPKY
jgi:hypothetical protein